MLLRVPCWVAPWATHAHCAFCADSTSKVNGYRRSCAAGEGRLRLVSLNVARPRLTVYNGTTINTGIFKQPVSGPVNLRTLNLDGDQQADLAVHGGPNKAAYGYPSCITTSGARSCPGPVSLGGCSARTSPPRACWRRTSSSAIRPRNWYGYPRRSPTSHSLPQAGGQVSSERYPGAFLAQRPQWVLLFGGTGGHCLIGSSFEFLSRAPGAITISEMNWVYSQDIYNRDLLEKAIATPTLPQSWGDHFVRRLPGHAATMR